MEMTEIPTLISYKKESYFDNMATTEHSEEKHEVTVCSQYRKEYVYNKKNKDSNDDVELEIKSETEYMEDDEHQATMEKLYHPTSQKQVNHNHSDSDSNVDKSISAQLFSTNKNVSLEYGVRPHIIDNGTEISFNVQDKQQQQQQTAHQQQEEEEEEVDTSSDKFAAGFINDDITNITNTRSITSRNDINYKTNTNTHTNIDDDTTNITNITNLTNTDDDFATINHNQSHSHSYKTKSKSKSKSKKKKNSKKKKKAKKPKKNSIKDTADTKSIKSIRIWPTNSDNSGEYTTTTTHTKLLIDHWRGKSVQVNTDYISRPVPVITRTNNEPRYLSISLSQSTRSTQSQSQQTPPNDMKQMQINDINHRLLHIPQPRASKIEKLEFATFNAKTIKKTKQEKAQIPERGSRGSRKLGHKHKKHKHRTKTKHLHLTRAYSHNPPIHNYNHYAPSPSAAAPAPPSPPPPPQQPHRSRTRTKHRNNKHKHKHRQKHKQKHLNENICLDAVINHFWRVIDIASTRKIPFEILKISLRVKSIDIKENNWDILLNQLTNFQPSKSITLTMFKDFIFNKKNYNNSHIVKSLRKHLIIGLLQTHRTPKQKQKQKHSKRKHQRSFSGDTTSINITPSSSSCTSSTTSTSSTSYSSSSSSPSSSSSSGIANEKYLVQQSLINSLLECYENSLLYKLNKLRFNSYLHDNEWRKALKYLLRCHFSYISDNENVFTLQQFKFALFDQCNIRYSYSYKILPILRLNTDDCKQEYVITQHSYIEWMLKYIDERINFRHNQLQSFKHTQIGKLLNIIGFVTRKRKKYTPFFAVSQSPQSPHSRDIKLKLLKAKSMNAMNHYNHSHSHSATTDSTATTNNTNNTNNTNTNTDSTMDHIYIRRPHKKKKKKKYLAVGDDYHNLSKSHNTQQSQHRYHQNNVTPSHKYMYQYK